MGKKKTIARRRKGDIEDRGDASAIVCKNAENWEKERKVSRRPLAKLRRNRQGKRERWREE